MRRLKPIELFALVWVRLEVAVSAEGVAQSGTLLYRGLLIR